jgi:hypothetical protein
LGCNVELIFSATPLLGYSGEDKIFPTVFKLSNTQNSQSEDRTDHNIRIMQVRKVNGVVSQNGEFTYLLNKDVNFIRAAYPLPTDTGVPEYYAIFDNNTFILGPTPDANYYVELHYYHYPESIVTAGSSWVGSNFAEVLLYGALREAYLFMKGEADIIQNYEQKYQEGMGLLKQLGDGKNRRDAYRNGQVRVPVT